MWFEGVGATAANARHLYADPRGSIVLVADAGGDTVGINTYDEYGIPGGGNTGRFQYTGQIWLSELGMYYYKARMYSPTLGRFMQTDPIGYADGMNMYAYTGNDPVNWVDPSGLSCTITNLTRTGYVSVGDGPPQPTTINIGVLVEGDCGSRRNVSPEHDGVEIVVTGKRPKKPLISSCVRDALVSGALKTAVDSIGLIPGGGGAKTIARRLGNLRGYRGAVADQ